MAGATKTSPRVDVDDDEGTITIRPGGARRPDPVGRAVRNDDAANADALEETLETIRDLMSDTTRLMLYRRQPAGGGLAYVCTLDGSDVDNIMDMIRLEYGGGRYQIRISVNGKVATAKYFEIEGLPIIKGDPNKKPDTSSDLTKLLIDQLAGNKGGDSNDVLLKMLQLQQAQSGQSFDKVVALVGALAPVLAAIVAKKGDSLADTMTALQPYISKPEKQDGNAVAELMTLLATAKEIVGGGVEAAGDANPFMSLMSKFAPVLLDGIRNQPPANAAPMQALPSPGPPRPPMTAPPPRPPMAPQPPPPPPHRPGEPLKPYMADPVLALIADDVLFMAGRKYETGLAAEAVLDRISKAQIAETDLMALVVRFNASPDWIAELFAQGLDLTAHKAWAEQFMAELVRQYAEQDGLPDDTGGAGGS